MTKKNIQKTILRYWLICGLLILTNHLCSGQEKLSHTLNSYFQEAHSMGPAPGFSVVVVKQDQVLFSGGYGLAYADKSIPMSAQTVSAMGSLTKSLTAMAMMQLVEQGKVDLDTPVNTYLSEFRTANPDKSAAITIRMLLNNSSGLPGGVSQKWSPSEQPLIQLMRSLESVYLSKEPGNSYEYSNAAFSLAGLVISRVSGMSYEAYIKQFILDPLNMKQTSTNPKEFERLHSIKGHLPGIQRGIPAERGFDSYEMIPAGSLFRSSAEDLGNYLIAMINGGEYKGKKVLQKESIETLWEPNISFPGLTVDMGGDGETYQYGLGWMISEVEGRRLIHHGGSTGTMSSMTVLYPDKELAASILFNVDMTFIDPYQFPSAFSIINNLFHLLEQEAATTFGIPQVPDPSLNSYQLPTVLHDSYCGSYQFNGKGDRRNFQGVELLISRTAEGKLIGETFRGSRLLSEFELDFVNEAHAISRNIGLPGSVRFIIQPDGTIRGLYFSGSEFRKQAPDYEQRFQWIELDNTKGGFPLPRNWAWNKEENTIFAEHPTEPIQLRAGKLTTQSSSLLDVWASSFPTHSILYQGQVHKEIAPNQVWRTQSISSQLEDQAYQHLILVNEANRLFFILTTPFGQLTSSLLGDISQIWQK